MSSYTAEKNIIKSLVIISENPEVYITETALVIKNNEYLRGSLRECRVEEVDSFLETDLFYSNEEGPGKMASKGLKWALGLFGVLNIFRDFTTTGDTLAQTADQTSAQDANPPLYCLTLLTDGDVIQVLPSINRLLLLDLAARINRELANSLDASVA